MTDYYRTGDLPCGVNADTPLCSVCGRPKVGIGIPIYGDPRCMACLAEEGSKEYVEPERSIRKDIEAGCYPFDENGYALVPMRNGDTATIAVTRSPAVSGWHERAGSKALIGWYSYKGKINSGHWHTVSIYPSGWEFALSGPAHPPGTYRKPAKKPFTGEAKTVRDHILAGHYPVDDDGHAEVPMRNGGTATIAMVDTPNPYGCLVGWRYERCHFLWGWDELGRGFDDGWREGKDDLLLPDGTAPIRKTRKTEPAARPALAMCPEDLGLQSLVSLGARLGDDGWIPPLVMGLAIGGAFLALGMLAR